MATAHMPEAYYDIVAPHLPPEPTVGPRGGRPGIGHRIVLRVLWFVLATGNRWADVPHELGCSGRTAHRRLRAWEEAGIWERIHGKMLELLNQAGKLDLDTVIVDAVTVRAQGGGEETGPSPVDRAKPGTKHTLLVDRQGVPLGIQTAGANASDHTQLFPTVVKFPKVKGKPGRPKERPAVVMADAGYDSAVSRAILRWMGIVPKIRSKDGEHGSGLGKVRWVVERTIAWVKGLRRMRVRYDRLGVIQAAWSTMATGVICFNILVHDELI
jgi:transposase